MAIKSVISNWTSNKVGGLLDKGIKALSGIEDIIGVDLTKSGYSIKTVYPIDLLGNQEYGEFIKFSMIQFSPVAKTGKPKPLEKITKKVSKSNPDLIKAALKAVGLTENYKEEPEEKKADLYLYIPGQSMVNATQTDWETKEASALTEAALASEGSASKFAGGAGDVAKGAGNKIVKSLLGSVGDTLEKARGKTTDANIQSFFTGVGLRKFSFAFEFAPRSEAELRNALIICNTFKKYSLPKRDGVEFHYPMAWRFSIHSNTDGSKLALMSSDKCYITGTTLNMAPESVWTTFNSGHPVVFTLNVSFVEDKVMDRDTYSKSNNGEL